jgi:cardiolipin synthase
MFLDESILTALKIAGLSGVDVKILLPKQSDHKFVHLGTRSYYYELIQANISIYEYRNGFMHAKVIIADDEYASVGSANMDIRSFSQNFEINAILYDLEDICILKDNFIKEISNADLIDNQWIDKRRWYKKLGESISRLFSPIF